MVAKRSQVLCTASPRSDVAPLNSPVATRGESEGVGLGVIPKTGGDSVTVLIGLRCRDGAVLACDSPVTGVNYFCFWTKANLLGNSFVVLPAGNLAIGEEFARRLSAA